MKRIRIILPVVLWMIANLLFGCSHNKDIVLEKAAKDIVKEYKLSLSLEKDDSGKRDLLIENKGDKTFYGTLLLHFDEKGQDDRVNYVVIGYGANWFTCNVEPGNTVRVWLSIYDEYQLDSDVLYVDLKTDPIGYAGRNSVEHWDYF